MLLLSLNQAIAFRFFTQFFSFKIIKNESGDSAIS